jgi:hypothetical protein
VEAGVVFGVGFEVDRPADGGGLEDGAVGAALAAVALGGPGCVIDEADGAAGLVSDLALRLGENAGDGFLFQSDLGERKL